LPGGRGKILQDIISEHASEAAFLWLFRDQAVRSPAYTLDDLAELDERLEAHLDGLRLAGEEAWHICQQEFGWGDPGEIFTGAIIAFARQRETWISQLLEYAAESPNQIRAAVSALGWMTWHAAAPHLRQLLSSENPTHRYIGIAGAAIHRADLGSLLEEVLRDKAPLVRARALRAVGEFGRVDMLNYCLQGLTSDDDDVRFWAAWSTLLLGDDNALGMLQRTVESNAPYADRAADIVVRRMSSQNAIQWLYQLAENPENQRRAIKLAGVIGDSELVPWLIQAIRKPELARIAGEACSMITGIDIAARGLEGNRPEGFQSGPTDAPEDEDVEVDPDEDLPWPDVLKVTEWWLGEQRKCTAGARRIFGKLISTEQLLDTLKFGTQPLRASAAMEAALLKADRPLFDVGARGGWQQTALGIQT